MSRGSPKIFMHDVFWIESKCERGLSWLSVTESYYGLRRFTAWTPRRVDPITKAQNGANTHTRRVFRFYSPCLLEGVGRRKEETGYLAADHLSSMRPRCY